MCKHLGYNITLKLNMKTDLAFAWENTTFRQDYPELREISEATRVLNIDCRDVGKRHLGKIFKECFGYSLDVNPLTHNGQCVQKSNLNASKSGVIVDCPIAEVDDGCAYQKLVNTEIEESVLAEIRVPVINQEIPHVYVKHKSTENRFGSIWSAVTVTETEEVFSEDEIKKIARFCGAYGLDFGEIDVLRDVDDGRIYIVDANNTPWGPPRDLPEREIRAVTRRLADLFRISFID